jgi:tRNA modification GTPase
LEVSLDVEGLPLIVCDTAGLRETQDVVERIGVEKAMQAYVLGFPSCVQMKTDLY